MSVINNLFIPCVEASYPAHDLIDAFYLSGIATVSEVDYEPYMEEGCLYNRAYIQVHEWHDTEVAYDFIKSLNDSANETVYRNDRVSFIVEINEEHWLTPLSNCYRTIVPLIHNVAGIVETSVCQDENEDQEDREEYEEDREEYEEDREEYEEDEDQEAREAREAREEYEYCMEQEDFIEEAKYYHEEVMEERLKNREIMTPNQFRAWEITSGFGKTKKECEYEVYLRTGCLF
jgi:hypothetical protein